MTTFKELTTIKTGGNIKHYFEVKNKAELQTQIKFAKDNDLLVFILGGGSDILVSDNDFNGVVIKYKGNNVKFVENGDFVLVSAEAGVVWDDLVAESVKRNLGGIESLSGIPGTVGAAPIQNIGAYGQELKDVFVSLIAYDIENEQFVEFKIQECQFDYRESIFKSETHWQRFVICEVTLILQKKYKSEIKYQSLSKYLNSGQSYSLQEIRDTVLKVRAEKLEDWKLVPNAGSFFKNPIIDEQMKKNLEAKYPDVKVYPFKDKYKVFAGWLVEKAGWKGKGVGTVKVSDKHALIITNPTGTATTADIVKLSEAIKNGVNTMFGITLEPEVQYINF